MKSNSKLYQIDSFTDKVFGGNPAAIMILESELEVNYMQQLAGEINLSETAFVRELEEGYEIRFFTPEVEVDICGHATLAAGFVLYDIGLISKSEPILFKAAGGELNVRTVNGCIEMDFPEFVVEKGGPEEGYLQSVGFDPIEVYSSEYHWVIAVADDEKTVRNAQANFAKMVEYGLGHLMITAPSDEEGIDFVCRCFAPISGINEDPVTGSAHCALTRIWADRLGKNQLVSKQVSKRTGVLHLERKDGRVSIRGNAVKVFEIEVAG